VGWSVLRNLIRAIAWGALFTALIVIGSMQHLSEEATLVVGVIAFTVVTVIRSWKWRSDLSHTLTSDMSQLKDGYVEVCGIVRALPEGLLRDPVSNTECVWFKVSTCKRDSRSNSLEKIIPFAQTESAQPFLLCDTSACCVVAPGGAHTRTPVHVVEDTEREVRHEIERILPGDKLTVIGKFTKGSHELADTRGVIANPGPTQSFLIASGSPQSVEKELRSPRFAWIAFAIIAVWLLVTLWKCAGK
jgi:hypothetical protein